MTMKFSFQQNTLCIGFHYMLTIAFLAFTFFKYIQFLAPSQPTIWHIDILQKSELKSELTTIPVNLTNYISLKLIKWFSSHFYCSDTLQKGYIVISHLCYLSKISYIQMLEKLKSSIENACMYCSIEGRSPECCNTCEHF